MSLIAVVQSTGYQTPPVEGVYPYGPGASATERWSKTVGINTFTPLFQVPSIHRGSAGTVWAYGKATVALPIGANSCTIDPVTGNITAGAGYSVVGNAFKVNDYGFIMKATPGTEF